MSYRDTGVSRKLDIRVLSVIPGCSECISQIGI